MAEPFLQFESITKSFPGVKALDNVSIGFERGKVHGIAGENGAGKSTLLNILSGIYRADSGAVRIGGRDCSFGSAHDAFMAGVAKIHQELFLVPEMTAAENLFLGHMPQTCGILNKKRLLESAREALSAVGEEMDPATGVKDLSTAQRQMLEIAKALSRNAEIIAFDEPTSSLTSRETEKLFSVIDNLKKHGKVIIYVTHRMEEVFRICDSLTIMRDGNKIVTFDDLSGITTGDIIRKMVGRDITDIFGYMPGKKGPVMLDVDGLMGRGIKSPVSFTASQGEITGLFGLVGAGRTELLKLIYGANKASSGTVKISGVPVRINSPIDAIKNGIILLPEDRKKEGIIPVRSVKENINLSARRNTSFLGIVIDGKWEEKNSREMVAKLKIKTPSLEQLIQNLSGGNQQKAILARWLSEEIKVLLLDEPTRGIDVGAKSEIYSFIYDLAQSGVAVIIVSSDLPEVLGVSDRVLVMCEGAITGELSRREATSEKVMKLALPGKAGMH